MGEATETKASMDSTSNNLSLIKQHPSTLCYKSLPKVTYIWVRLGGTDGDSCFAAFGRFLVGTGGGVEEG